MTTSSWRLLSKMGFRQCFDSASSSGALSTVPIKGVAMKRQSLLGVRPVVFCLLQALAVLMFGGRAPVSVSSAVGGSSCAGSKTSDSVLCHLVSGG